MPQRVERNLRIQWLKETRGRRAYLLDLTGCPSDLPAQRTLLAQLSRLDPTVQVKFVKNSYIKLVHGLDLHHSGLLVVTKLEQTTVFDRVNRLRSTRVPRVGQLLELPCIVPAGLTSSRPSGLYTQLSSHASTKLNKGLVEFLKPFVLGVRGTKATDFIRSVCNQFGTRQYLIPTIKGYFSEGHWTQGSTKSWRPTLYQLLSQASRAHNPWLSERLALSYLGTRLAQPVMERFYARVEALKTEAPAGPVEEAVKAALGDAPKPKPETAPAETAQVELDFFL